MPLSTSDKLGPYEILAPLGFGGMGQGGSACDKKLGRVTTTCLATCSAVLSPTDPDTTFPGAPRLSGSLPDRRSDRDCRRPPAGTSCAYRTERRGMPARHRFSFPSDRETSARKPERFPDISACR